jgi:hypothetical protein
MPKDHIGASFHLLLRRRALRLACRFRFGLSPAMPRAGAFMPDRGRVPTGMRTVR